MTKKYTRTIKAALAETKGTFAIAEALALDIPKAQGQTGVKDELIKVRAAIIKVGAEPRSVDVLSKMRLVALHFSPNGAKAEWVDGY